MKQGLIGTLAGLLVGFVVGALGAGVHYKKRSQKEIDSASEAFRKRLEELANEKEAAKKEEKKTETPADIPEAKTENAKPEPTPEEKQRYENLTNLYKPFKADIFTISPDTYQNGDPYMSHEYKMYADKTICEVTETGMEIPLTPDKVQETIGWEALDKFGEYEEDCVYVRNNKLHTEYAVSYAPGKYTP